MAENNFNPQCITYSQMNMIFNARIYYRRLITWTRAYIFSKYFGIGTTETLFNHLYQESIDIGNILQIIFGRVFSDEYGQLLARSAILTRELLEAQSSGDVEAINRTIESLKNSINDRAAFLEALNPYWSKEEYIKLFTERLNYTIELANAYVTGDYLKVNEMYDNLSENANKLGDTFALGIYNYMTSGSQGPETFTPVGNVQCVTNDQMNNIFQIRMFWYELATWIRTYMVSRYMGIGNVNANLARLKEVPVNYVSSIKDVFGDQVTEEYIGLFNTFIDLLEAFITAQMEGNVDQLNQITKSLYQNSDQRAAFIASINPFWDENEWKNRLHDNISNTIAESTTFLTKDYEKNIDIFSTLLDQAESTSNYFAQGLFSYINSKQQMKK